MQGLFALGMLAIVVFVVVKAISTGQKADQAWGHAASQLGLAFSKGGMLTSRRIHGRVDPFLVEVDTFSRQHGKNNRVTYTRFRLSYPSLNLGLKITEEGFWSGVTKFFGSQDINVGDADFDGAAVVKGANEADVREFLTPARRLRLQRFLLSHSEVQIDDTSIQWAQRGLIRDAALIVRWIKEMHALADHLTHDDADSALDAALDAHRIGHAEEAIEILADHRQQLEQAHQPIDTDEQLLEGEWLYLAEKPGEAKRRFDDAFSESPEDEELRQWSEGLESRSPSVPPAVPPAVTPTVPPTVPPVTASDAGPSLTDVCQGLFAAGQTSYRITREFETSYRGQSIRWTGTVRRAERYSYDLVFGSGPGCRCVLDLDAGIESDLSSQPVSAIVQFPLDTLDRLTKATGHPLTFKGTLRKVDGLLRKLYVTDGELDHGGGG